ncbi:oxidoreductase [Streptomyces sp. NPDC047043]|uniref:oxidoreductase n=1 Tax=Streptomyces sp. NPDC047043 TaxID=3154497 RepID=UPI0033DB8329
MPDRDPDDGPPADLDFSTAERNLWDAYRYGRQLDLSTGRAADDDPLADDTDWAPERRIRGFVIVRLLLRGPAPHTGHAAAVRLKGACVTGFLDLSGAETGTLLELVDCKLEMPLRLTGAQANSVHLRHCWIPRVEAEGFTSRGSLLLEQCLVTDGITIQQAQIGMDFSLSKSTVRVGAPGPAAVDADGLTVAQDVIADSLRLTGAMSLRGANIGGDFSLRGSALRNPDGTALHAPRITVAHEMILSWGSGPESLPPGEPEADLRPRVEGRICLDGGTFGTSLVINRAVVALGQHQNLSLRRIQTPELVFNPDLRFDAWNHLRPVVDVSHATVGILRDSPTSWPRDLAMLAMSGFRYGYLSPLRHFPLTERLAWVESATPEYSPEPYDALAATLRASGDDHAADMVLLGKRRRRRQQFPAPLKIWEYTQDLTFGYGYLPGRAWIIIQVLWAYATVWFANFPPPPQKPGEGLAWSPPAYALDLLLPVVDLGQASAWHPTGASLFISWVLIITGWILTTIVTAGAAKVVFRPD